MNKEEQIASIKQRIIDEHRKHKDLDWAEIAARKIYSTHLVKEKCNLPIVSGSACPKCGCQIYSPFGDGRLIHDVDSCGGIVPKKEGDVTIIY